MQNDKQKFKENFMKRLVAFSVDIIKFSRNLKQDKFLWPISSQLIRSASSVGANVFEAKGSSSRRDYARFFEIALKSSNETKYWFMVIKESTKEFQSDIDNLYKEIEEISKIIGSSVLTLRDKR